MARPVEQIKQDIVALEQTTATIARELYDLYRQYLTDLGDTIRRQLVLAGYHLCTQGYPERFLRLSLRQKQDFQQALRKLSHQAQGNIIALLSLPGGDENVLALSMQTLVQPNQEQEAMATDPVPVTEAADNRSEGLDRSSDRPARVDDSETNTVLPHLPPPPEQNQDPAALPTALPPLLLALWQQTLESAMVAQLRAVSHSANRLLQQSDILPQKLPEPLLEALAKAETAGDAVTGTPNLLTLMLESESKGEEESTVTQIMAIRLRLAELEFNDTQLTAKRQRIRAMSGRLNQVGREYQKRQREQAIAEAEAAWRASWYEE